MIIISPNNKSYKISCSSTNIIKNVKTKENAVLEATKIAILNNEKQISIRDSIGHFSKNILVTMSKNKNTTYSQKSILDQFYTNDNIAKKCYDAIWKIFNKSDFDLFLEPSAGTGAFFKLFPINIRIGLDLDPKMDEVQHCDFFKFEAPENKNIITIGNPPFGRVSSDAIKFFNKAAEFSKVIAFIIPKTFKKNSLQNKLNLNFKLKSSIDLPKNSFLFNNKPYDVPCCFQIWEKSNIPRKIKNLPIDNDFFIFVKKNEADFAVRRVGGRAGKATEDILELSESSHYFLKMKTKKINKNKIIDIFNSVDYSKVSNSTAGVKSISKPELIYFFLKNIKE